MAELGLSFWLGSKNCADPGNTFDFGCEMRVFFERQQQRMGFDDEFLADHFAICSRPAAVRLMKLFHQGKSLKPVFVKRIQELLCISERDFANFEKNFKIKMLTGRNMFFANLGLFLKHAGEIASNPAYANVIFHTLKGPKLPFRRSRPLTVGELVSSYASEQMIFTNLSGHRSYVYGIDGGIGKRTVHAFDSNPGAFFRTLDPKIHRRMMWIYENFEPSFAYTPSVWTVSGLIDVLETKCELAAY